MASIYLPFEIDGVTYVAPIEYVFSILPASESLPTCTPPLRPGYVERVLQLEQGLVTVIEWSLFAGSKEVKTTVSQREFLLILRYQGWMLGIKTDHVASPFECLEPNLEWDAVNRQTMLAGQTVNYVLFDVPGFYSKANTM